MPTIDQYPGMAALTGSEKLLGTQSGSTETVTVQQVADYAAAQGTAGVVSVNGQSGVATLTASDVGADPAGRGDTAENNAATALAAHVAIKNPHGLAKADLGLGNVDNTSDLNKPVSTAMQSALNAKPNDAASDGTAYLRQNAAWVSTARVVILSQAEYDALTPDATILYVVT